MHADRTDDRPRDGAATARRWRELVADAEAAERAGFALDLGAPAPGRLRRPDRDRAHGPGDRAASSSGRRSLPIQTRHPVAMAQQALSNQAVCEGRFTLGLGPSHHWIVDDMLGLPYDQARPPGARLPRGAERGVRRPGPGRRRERRLPRAQPARRHRHRPTPVLLAALAPVMLRIAGEHAVGHDPLDGRRAGDRRARRARGSRKAAAEAGRPEPAHRGGRPGRAVRRRRGRRRRASGPTRCSGTPSTRPTTSGCSSTATPPTSATCSRPATRPRSSSGCAASATPASPTSPSASLPLGADRDARIESRAAHRALPLVALPRALSVTVTDASPGPLAGIRDPRGRAHPRGPVRAACSSPTSAPTSSRSSRSTATSRARSDRTTSTSTTCTSRA